MARSILDELALGGRPLRFQCPPDDAAVLSRRLTEWQSYLASAGVVDDADSGMSADLHGQILRFMASVGAVAKSASDHAVVAMCREHFDYFTAKSHEHGTDFATWENGVRFDRPSADGQRVMTDVVRETIEHLLTLARSHPNSGDNNAVGRLTAGDSPVTFVASEDDSRKPRSYYYFGNELAMVETHYEAHLLLDLCDLTLTPTILKTGWWEPWIDTMLRSTLQGGMTYVNAGANIGYYTVLGGKLVDSYGKVFSFEGNPHAYSLLRRSVYFNGFSGRTALFQAAVHEHSGEMQFHYVREMLGGGGLMFGPAGYNAKDFQHLDGRHRLRERFIYEPADFVTVKVPAVTIDEAVSPEAETIDMLHMDIEGSEALALLGAREIIGRSRNIQMIIEWSLRTIVDEGLRDNFKRAAQMLADENFKIYAITPPQGNIYTTTPDLRRIEIADLMTIPHTDLYLTRN